MQASCGALSVVRAFNDCQRSRLILRQHVQRQVFAADARRASWCSLPSAQRLSASLILSLHAAPDGLARIGVLNAFRHH